MAASRATSVRALNQLAASSRQTQVRKLHITGPSTFPSPLLTTERPAVQLPKDVAGLRDECRKRQLPSIGSQSELIDRLQADELVRSRSFSTAVERDTRRPAVSEADAYMAMPPARHFNTSRSLKKVKDSSTIDFAYFPDFDPDMEGPAPGISVPLLPQSVLRDNAAAEVTVAATEDVGEPSIIFKPTVGRSS